jgi:ribosomal protein S18 acetylase RimI-like enzyme
MQIVRLGSGDEEVVLAAAGLFDRPPAPEWTARFLSGEGHHLLVAMVAPEDDLNGDRLDCEEAVGFVTGVEMTHPDKGTEMFLYELGVREDHRRRGIGKALVTSLAQLAVTRGCYGMWVAVEPDNAPALATYRSAGAEPPEPAVLLAWRTPIPQQDGGSETRPQD